jgi:hypothetical protein
MRNLAVASLLLLAFAGTASAQTVDNTVNTNSTSGAVAGSNSESAAGASSDNLNVVNPNQSTELSVGVGLSQTFEASQIPTTTTQKVKTNAAVPLAAAVSFSSDYCGGTVSAGASGFGVSLGASGPKMDGNCQSLRRAEKFGTAAANAYNAGLHDMASRLIVMQVWEICMAETNAKQEHEPRTQGACEGLGLLSMDVPQPKSEPAVPQQQQYQAPQEYQPRQPRGEVTEPSEASKKIAATTIRGSNGQSVELDEDGKKVR